MSAGPKPRPTASMEAHGQLIAYRSSTAPVDKFLILDESNRLRQKAAKNEEKFMPWCGCAVELWSCGSSGERCRAADVDTYARWGTTYKYLLKASQLGQRGSGMDFFLQPAGGLGPLAERGSVLPAEECHDVYGERAGRARRNFLRRRRQMAKLVCAAVSQEIADEQRNFANGEEIGGSIAALQKDLRGICDVQAKMEHETASLVTGLWQLRRDLRRCAHACIPGHFWASMKGMRGAGRLPLATTGAAPKPTKSDVTSDVGGLYGVLTRVELLEETRDMREDAMQTEAARRGGLAVEVDRLRVELEASRQGGVKGQLHASGGLEGSIRDAIREGAALGCCGCNEGGHAARDFTSIEEGAGGLRCMLTRTL